MLGQRPRQTRPIVIALAVALLTSACTSLRVIGPADIPGRLKVGDRVIILTKDGQEARFEISMLTPDTIEGREHTIRLADIRTLERREFDPGKLIDVARFTVYAIAVVAAVAMLLFTPRVHTLPP